MSEEKKGFKFPSAYTVLFLLIILIAIGTWFIPAGSYEYDEEGSPIPGTYHELEQNPQRLRDVILAPINGMYGIEDETGNVDVWNYGALFGAIDVALFVLVIGGFLGLTMKTGAIDAGIARITDIMKGREKWMIPVLMIVFAIGGTTYGMAEETLAFYVLIITVLIAAGYDAMTGVAVVMLGAGIGVLGSTLNPFATGIASAFAGISVIDGIVWRLVILVLGSIIGIWYVMRYAEKVRKDPSQSIVYDKKEENEKIFLSSRDADAFPELTSRRKWVLVLFALSFLIMIYGVIPWEDLGVTFLPTLWWWFPELTALFLFMAIVIGIVYRMSEGELTSSFIEGARDLLGVALIIAIARGITVIMNNGLITDTVLYWAEQAVVGLRAVGFVEVTYLLYLPLSFLIPSTSGLATVSMPIMAPLADFAGVGRDLVVTAFQSASGLLNLVTVTSAVVMGGLAIGRVGYDQWWKFVWKIMLMLFLLVFVVLAIATIAGQSM